MTTNSIIKIASFFLLLIVLPLLCGGLPTPSSDDKEPLYRQHRRLRLNLDSDSVASRLTRSRGSTSKGSYAAMHNGGSSSKDEDQDGGEEHHGELYEGSDADEEVDWKRLKFLKPPKDKQWQNVDDLIEKNRNRGRDHSDADLRIDDLRKCYPHRRFEDTRAPVLPENEADLTRTEKKNWCVFHAVQRRMDVSLRRSKIFRDRPKKSESSPR